jgi:putative PIN family toxin of toxin-antitoxin system
MPEVVIDSTVLVSAFLTARPGGASHELLRFAAAGAFTLHLSPAIVRETERVLLTSKRLREHYAYRDEDVRIFITNLVLLAEMTGEITDIPRANDDMVIACALAIDADHVVSRDRDLLDLYRHNGITILFPEDFLAKLRQQ